MSGDVFHALEKFWDPGIGRAGPPRGSKVNNYRVFVSWLTMTTYILQNKYPTNEYMYK